MLLYKSYDTTHLYFIFKFNLFVFIFIYFKLYFIVYFFDYCNIFRLWLALRYCHLYVTIILSNKKSHIIYKINLKEMRFTYSDSSFSHRGNFSGKVVSDLGFWLQGDICRESIVYNYQIMLTNLTFYNIKYFNIF